MKKLFFIFFLISFNAVYAQNTALKIANKHFEAGAYLRAIDAYEKLIESGLLTEDVKRKAQIKLGFSYRKIKDYSKAEVVFKNLVSTSPNLTGPEVEAYLQYAQILATNGKHVESQEMFRKYGLSKGGNDPYVVSTMKLYENLDALNKNASSYQVDYLGINTHLSEFSPVFYKGGLVFVTGRNTGGAIKRVSASDNTPFLDLFFVENIQSITNAIGKGAFLGANTKQNTGVAYVPKSLGSEAYTPETANDTKILGLATGTAVNGSLAYEERATVSSDVFSKNLTSKFHDGPVTFFKDFSKVIFTRNSKEKSSNGFYQLGLYMADFVGNEWRNITPLPFMNPEYSYAHPALSPDNRILYFASNIPGGFGGSDLYMIRYDGSTWGQPINLGDKVNTPQEDVFPFIDDKGNLYFSSKGHPGLGEMDVFYTKLSPRDGLPIANVRNLGAPINSTKDDFGLIADADRKYGFFSSNRKRAGNDDDIYSFERKGPLYGCLEKTITVVDANDKKNIPFVNVKYEQKNSTSQSIYTDSKGVTKICIDPENEYWLTASVDGYVANTIKISTYDEGPEDNQKIKIDLKRQLFVEKAKPPVKKIEKVESVLASAKEQLLPVSATSYFEKVASPKFEEAVIEDVADTSAIEILYRGIVTEGSERSPVEGAIVVFRNQCDGTTQRFVTKADGVYEFKRELGCDYAVEVLKEKYENTTETFKKVRNTRRIRPTITFGSKVFREGDVVAIDRIYYKEEEFKLNKESKRELDKLIATLEKFPGMLVEVRSHTDSRGQDRENMQLSQRRAEEVAAYVIRKGISPNRIMAKGYGELELKNNCGNGVQCTEQEHFKNRRTEFKVLTLSR